MTAFPMPEQLESEGISLQGLARRYGDFEAVRPLSLEISRGEIFGLLGPNGAGKTSTLAMLATLLAPSAGDAWVFGRSLAREPEAVRPLVGLVPQDLSLYQDLSAEENLRFFASINGIPAREREVRIDELLNRVSLESRRRDRVAEFSGGMKRRLNLACSLVHRPQLLLLDEPTVGVDPQSRESLFEAVRRLAEEGAAVLYTTHYMEEAERLCSRIAILDEGRMIALGALDELLELVDHKPVAEPPKADLGRVFMHLTGRELRD
ncbi:MAG: ABC transporter ATP-binding protein [Myxococcota bacterium]